MAVGLASIATDEGTEMALARALWHTKLSHQHHRDNILHQTLFFNTSAAQISKSLTEELYGFEKDSQGVIVFTSEDLKAFTDNLNEENRIGQTQFGDVYRGKMWIGGMPRNVVVKIWNERAIYLGDLRVPHIYVNEEVLFLKHETTASQPCLPNVIGKCCERNMEGIVYDIDPLNTLHNMITKDDFSWAQRIKVALRFALLLEFLHGQENPYVVLNLDPRHIMLDCTYNPLLFEFGLLSGGVIGELSFIKKLCMPPPGYVDPDHFLGRPLSPSRDVYIYGVILAGMIAKKVVEKRVGEKRDLSKLVPPLDDWAKMEYRANSSLVHRSLELEWGYYASDATSLTELAMCCMKSSSVDRPSMAEVVNSLKQLQVVECHLQL